MNSDFNMDTWRSQLGLDTEHLTITIRFPAAVLNEPVDSFLRLFEDLYDILADLVYSGKERPSSAPLRFEGEERGGPDGTFAAVYEGNVNIVRELCDVLRTRATFDAKGFTQILVRHMSENARIDMQVMGRLLETGMQFTKWLEDSEKVAELTVSARSGTVELLKRP